MDTVKEAIDVLHRVLKRIEDNNYSADSEGAHGEVDEALWDLADAVEPGLGQRIRAAGYNVPFWYA